MCTTMHNSAAVCGARLAGIEWEELQQCKVRAMHTAPHPEEAMRGWEAKKSQQQGDDQWADFTSYTSTV